MGIDRTYRRECHRRIGRVLVHLGWLLVLPFALCNLAYWTRRIESPSSPAALE